MSIRRPVHVVYGYPSGVAPIGEPTIKGFGSSDRTAYEDAKRQEGQTGIIYYFVRFNGDLKPVSRLDVTTGSTARERAAKRFKGFERKRDTR